MTCRFDYWLHLRATLTNSDLGLPFVSIRLFFVYHVEPSWSILELRLEVNPTQTQLDEELSVIVHDGLRNAQDSANSDLTLSDITFIR